MVMLDEEVDVWSINNNTGSKQRQPLHTDTTLNSCFWLLLALAGVSRRAAAAANLEVYVPRCCFPLFKRGKKKVSQLSAAQRSSAAALRSPLIEAARRRRGRRRLLGRQKVVATNDGLVSDSGTLRLTSGKRGGGALR